MMKVLQDNTITIDRNASYVKKKCTACGSVLDINNGDILSEKCDDNNVIKMKCPCCGSTFYLNKYFTGKKYTIDEYSEVVAKFSEDVSHILSELYQINIGYGREYINISAIGLVGTETSVCIVVYVNQYKNGDWDKLLYKNVYYNQFVLDVASKILCDTFYDYARYSQALLDYVKKELSDERRGRMNGYFCRDFFEETDSITTCLRGGDFGTIVDIGDKHYNLTENKKIEDKTIYTPNIKYGLEYVGDKIEDGSINIMNGLYAIACTIHNASIADCETTKRHEVNVYGHVH